MKFGRAHEVCKKGEDRLPQAGRMRWAREGRTDSRRRTCVAPESARMGKGVIEHNRGVW
jgi:hypothetical protein